MPIRPTAEKISPGLSPAPPSCLIRMHHVALIADEAYARGLAVTLQSFLASLSAASAGVHVWLVDTGLSAQTWQHLQHLVDQHNSSSARTAVTLHQVTQDATSLYRLPACDSYASQWSWLKAVLPQLLLPLAEAVSDEAPSDLLYLDCDMLVREDACSGLLGDKAVAVFKDHPQALIAAVRDFGLPCGHSQLLLLEQQQPQPPSGSSAAATPTALLPASCSFEWPPGSSYFNAGLLLFNLAAWREQQQEVHAALLQFGFEARSSSGAHSASSTTTITRGLRYHDQDALNLLCLSRGGWVELDHRWNVQGIGTYLRDRTRASAGPPESPALFTADAAAALEQSPAVVHFTGPPTVTPSQLLNPYMRQPSKPWAVVCQNPYTEEWLRVLDSTGFCPGWRPDQHSLAEAAVEELVELCRKLQPAQGSVSSSSSSSVVLVGGGAFDAQAFLRSVGELCLLAAAADECPLS